MKIAKRVLSSLRSAGKVAILLALASIADEARATPQFSVELFELDVNLVNRSFDLVDNPISATATGFLPNSPSPSLNLIGFGDLRGHAAPGVVTAFIDLTLRTTNSTGQNVGGIIGGKVVARSVIDDLVLTGPADSVEARLVFDVSGFVNELLLGFDDQGGDSSNDRDITVTARLRGEPPGGGVTSAERTLHFDDTASGTFMTPVETFRTGVPLEALLEITVDSRVFVRRSSAGLPDERSDLLVDFSDTVSFATAGPVILFGSEGFNAESQLAGIVNNRFSLIGIPEPGGMALLLTGLAGLGVVRARRRCSKTVH